MKRANPIPIVIANAISKIVSFMALNSLFFKIQKTLIN